MSPTELIPEIEPQIRLRILPHEMRPDRLASIQAVRKLVTTSSVHRRGWPFPPDVRIEEKGQATPDGYSYTGQFESHCEYWLALRSGQYFYVSRFREQLAINANGLPPAKVLSLDNAVYCLTEYCEFAHRWLLGLKDRPGATLIVEYANVKGFALGEWPTARGFLPSSEPTLDPSVKLEQNLPSPSVIESYDEIALSLALDLVAHFGLLTGRESLRRIQNDLLAMQIGGEPVRQNKAG